MGELLTELSEGVVSLVGTLPEYATVVKEFGENLMFDVDADGTKTVSGIFGWLVLGGIVTLGIAIVKSLTKKLSSSK